MKNKRYSQVDASVPTIRRLPSYLNVIRRALEKNLTVISGTVIALELELEPIQVRKDLAVTGIVGKPRVGYNVKELKGAIETFLNWNKKQKAIVIGTGNLGKALIGYPGFKDNGMDIVACFDNSPEKIGSIISNVETLSMDELSKTIKNKGVEIAILTVPSEHAQDVTNILVDAKISAIWNFTNEKLKVSEDVLVLREDLSSSYAVLSVCK
ncbi:MAG: redox-sensing transcriptional repressor Rex [Spirochaetaceae bacterium 4572_7]|nr:MAG: redox-sensing transcriptional repressor Rex [Spirochaetaceae bacterium 4572_7]